MPTYYAAVRLRRLAIHNVRAVFDLWRFEPKIGTPVAFTLGTVRTNWIFLCFFKVKIQDRRSAPYLYGRIIYVQLLIWINNQLN